jgi:hypothetical protein
LPERAIPERTLAARLGREGGYLVSPFARSRAACGLQRGYQRVEEAHGPGRLAAQPADEATQLGRIAVGDLRFRRGALGGRVRQASHSEERTALTRSAASESVSAWADSPRLSPADLDGDANAPASRPVHLSVRLAP